MQVIVQTQGAVTMGFPVVEIAGDDHRCVGGKGFEQLA
jgi:hypothetical protein